MRENLDDSLKLMFGHEGGYSSAKTDKGNYFKGVLVGTKYGIIGATLAASRGVSKITATDMKTLTLAEAETIYRKSYWPQSGGDLLPAGLDYAAFDFGVNSGPPKAVKTLQQVLGFKGGDVDGWIGVETMRRVNEYPGGVKQLIRDYCDARMAFLRSLKNPKTGFPVNGRGWTIRVTGIDPKGEWKSVPGVVGNALAMASGGKAAAQVDVTPAPMPTEVATEAGAKAEPAEPNPWTKPDVLLPIGGAAATGAGTVLTSGMDPIRLAIALAIIVVVGLGAFYAFRRITKGGAT
jgi:lysozyme family protein